MHGPVHRTAVDIRIGQIMGELFGQRTLATTAESINGYDDLFHVAHFTAAKVMACPLAKDP